MQEQPQEKEKKPKKIISKGVKDFARYSGIGFQMLGIILVTTWGGTRLDRITGFETPVFTIILSLLGVFAAIYTAVKDLIK